MFKHVTKEIINIPLLHLILPIVPLHRLLRWGWPAAAAALCSPFSSFYQQFLLQISSADAQSLRSAQHSPTADSVCSHRAPAVFNSARRVSQPCGYDEPSLKNEGCKSSQLASSQHVYSCSERTWSFSRGLHTPPIYRVKLLFSSLKRGNSPWRKHCIDPLLTGNKG